MSELNERALFEAWSIAERERWSGHKLDDAEKDYLLRRLPGDRSCYSYAPAEWPAFRAGLRAALAHGATSAPALSNSIAENLGMIPEVMHPADYWRQEAARLAARIVVMKRASSAPAESLRNDLMAVDSKLVAIINAADGSFYNKLKDARNDLVRIWLPLSKATATSTATPASAQPAAWLATDLDGRGDEAFTKEEAKRRAGEGCTTFYPLYEPSACAATHKNK